MATIKISNLNQIEPLNPNTGNVAFVATDIQSGVSGKITATTLAAGLFANNVLNVGNTQISFPNVVAQFAKEGESYIQVNLLNTDAGGSADYVVTAESGTDIEYFIDMGYANKDFVPGSEYNSLGDSIHPLDGYLYVQGNSSAINVGGNLVIGTTTTHSHVKLIAGGGTNENVVAEITETQFGLNRTIVFGDGTTQNTSFGGAAVAANTPSHVANSAASYANSAFIAANGISSVANSASLYANGAFTKANAAFNTANTPSHVANSASLYANGAFTKANNALANTTGTFDGDLTVTGNIVSKYALTVNHPSMPGNSQYIIVTGTATGAIGAPTNPGYTFHSAVDTGNRVVAEAYSNTASDYASFIGRRARGTAANPLAIQSGDTIVRFGGNGYGNTKFSQFSDARIEFVATENHTDTAKGTKIRFMNTQDGSNTATEIATFNANTVTFTGSVTPQKGFVYTPRVLSGAQTAITIDFTTDSIIRATFSSTLTVTLSNYIAGKIVDLWVTNTAGNGQTVNFGSLANNTTTGATSLSIASGRSAKIQYFSIDGDQANTFVAVTYA
jgi:hypothetical protein